MNTKETGFQSDFNKIVNIHVLVHVWSKHMKRHVLTFAVRLKPTTHNRKRILQATVVTRHPIIILVIGRSSGSFAHFHFHAVTHDQLFIKSETYTDTSVSVYVSD